MDFGWLLCVNIGSSLIFKKCISVVRDVDNEGGNACMWEGVYGKSSHPYTYRGCIYWAYYSRKTEKTESGLLMTSLTTVLIFQVHEKLNMLVTNNPSLTILLQADRVMWYISVPWPPHCKTIQYQKHQNLVIFEMVHVNQKNVWNMAMDWLVGVKEL